MQNSKEINFSRSLGEFAKKQFKVDGPIANFVVLKSYKTFAFFEFVHFRRCVFPKRSNLKNQLSTIIIESEADQPILASAVQRDAS